jgi:hypothetical protein
VSHLKYGEGIHEEHPIPVTQTMSFGDMWSSSTARVKRLSTVPHPQPAQNGAITASR